LRILALTAFRAAADIGDLWGAKTSSRRPDVLVNDTAKTITSQNTSVT
jgi:hypothetical protein